MDNDVISHDVYVDGLGYPLKFSYTLDSLYRFSRAQRGWSDAKIEASKKQCNTNALTPSMAENVGVLTVMQGEVAGIASGFVVYVI